jgi:hypothetical protein
MRAKRISKVKYYSDWIKVGLPKRFGKGKAFRVKK